MIVVTTPTGRIGAEVLERLLAAGASTRVVVRDPEGLSDRVHAGADVIGGSHNDAAVLTRALDGAESLFWLVPPDFQAADARAHYEAFTSALVEALAVHPVRVVAVSSLGRGYPEDAGLLSPAWAMEETVEATGVPLRALRPGFFMENLIAQVALVREKGTFAMANAPQEVLHTVATTDVARAASELLLDPSWSDQAGVPLISDALTPAEMADVMSDVLDRPVRLTPVTPEQLKATMPERGASDSWAQGMADMVTAQNDGVYSAEPVEQPSGPHTPFVTWCEQVLKPAVVA